MTGMEFKKARKAKGWSQCGVAKRLGVSQTYVALLESDIRPFTPGLTRKAVTLLKLNPSALPLESRASTDNDWMTRELSALGYPGYAHVRPVHRKRNPAEVLLTALGMKDLEARVAEALPWLLLRYGVTGETKNWLVDQARSRNLTNRVGFTVTLAKEVAEQKGETTSEVYQTLVQLEQELRRSRLAEPDTFCLRHLTDRQREWLETARPDAAKQWNMLTTLQPGHLQYV